MAAMLKIAGVSMKGVSGQFRSNGEQIGWRGGEGTVVSCAMASIAAAEWMEGKLRVAYRGEDGCQHRLKFDGFNQDCYEAIRIHFMSSCGIHVKDHGAAAAKEHGAVPGVAAPVASTLLESSGMNPLKKDDAVKPAKAGVDDVGDVNGNRGSMPCYGPGRGGDDAEYNSYSATTFAKKEKTAAGEAHQVYADYVMKQSHYLGRWRSRWVVLAADGTLKSYRRKGDAVPTVVMQPSSVRAGMGRSKDDANGDCFTVSKRGVKGRELMHFKCKDTASQQIWVEKVSSTRMRM